jgi:ABC-type transport system substrate-binding protein
MTTTVKFVMSRPEPNLLYNLSSTFMGVVEPKSYAALGDNYGVTEVYGTGPFKLESFTIGQETVLVRNDDYTWGPVRRGQRRPRQDRHADLPRNPRGFDRLPGAEDRRRRHAAWRAAD